MARAKALNVTKDKNCYCHTCDKPFHYLGVANHRLRHKNRKEDCWITYTNGDTYAYKFSEPNKAIGNEPTDYQKEAVDPIRKVMLDK